MTEGRLSPTPQAERGFGLSGSHLLSSLKIVDVLFRGTIEGALSRFTLDFLAH